MNAGISIGYIIYINILIYIYILDMHYCNQCLYASLVILGTLIWATLCCGKGETDHCLTRQEAHQIQKGQSSWDGTVSERMKLEVAYLGPLAPDGPRSQ